MLTLETIWDVTRRTVLIASTATAIATPPGLALAWLLARRRFRGRALVQTLVMLPVVLPPVAIGLVLLELLSPRAPWAGVVFGMLGGNPLFTWRAAVIASAVMGMPLMVRTAEAAFAGVPRRLELVASGLGASGWRVFRTVTLPLAGRGVAYAVLLCFLRALGEFGATTMVAGNIEGQTQTLALAIYAHTVNFEDRDALWLAAIALLIAATATALGEAFLRPAGPAERVRG